MTSAADGVVQLKRRVRNDRTELFEWRKCQCRVTGDGQLILETVDEDDHEKDADPRPTEEEHAADTPDSTRVVIDLAWQLHAIEQKRKCKTRCELQFVVQKEMKSEELMAPSPRHCQQWIELVREAEKHAKRRESIRQGTATATAVAAMNSTLAISSSSSVTSPSLMASAAPFDTSLSSVSAESMASSIGPPIVALKVSTRKETPPKRCGQPTSDLPSQRNRYDESEPGEDQELLSPVGLRSTAPLPRASSIQQKQRPSSVRRLLSRDLHGVTEAKYDVDDSIIDQPQRRTDAHQYNGQPDDDENEEEEEDDGQEDEDEDELQYVVNRRTPPPPAVPRLTTKRPSLLHSAISAAPRRKKPPVLSPSSLLSSSHGATRHTRRVFSPPSSALSSSAYSPARRPSPATLLRRRPLSATRTHSAAAVAASIQRLRRREGLLRGDHDDCDEVHEPLDHQGDTREELDILMRVESALRHLERENAAAKDREASLAHQVSSLQDALRVRSAEKKHLEGCVAQLARDKDAWKLAAQRAERALAQLQDELAIAQEETQLQHSERHRLTHHNKELLSQVHRLDSIVYGRF
jgi:hypothetical protein